jgi:hypothetical protein
MKSFLCSIFLIIIFNAPIKPQNTQTNSGFTETFNDEYFPLKDKTSFIFDSNLGSTKANIYTEGKQMAFEYEAGGITYKQNLYKDAKGIYLTKVYSKAMFFSSTVTYDKPLLRIPLPLKIGDTWKWEGNEIINGEYSKLNVFGKALAVETIKTKAGEFRCLKVMLKIISAKGKTNTEVEWLAPNIGIVRVFAKIQGEGITGTIQNILGLDELKFSIAEIK